MGLALTCLGINPPQPTFSLLTWLPTVSSHGTMSALRPTLTYQHSGYYSGYRLLECKGATQPSCRDILLHELMRITFLICWVQLSSISYINSQRLSLHMQENGYENEF